MKKGFTLIELLAVVATIGIIISLLIPVVASVRESGRSTYCCNNLKQLYIANDLYSIDHGSYVAAAPEFYQNKKRWHGERTSANKPFDGTKGPLVPYLGTTKKVRQCPSFHGYNEKSFEASAGGYGYNAVGVGSRSYILGANRKGFSTGMSPGMIQNPDKTIMFTDAAFIRDNSLMEYSFSEPYYSINWKGKEGTKMQPSVHFRHGKEANVVWCDGHISSETMTIKENKKFAEMELGWFGEANNDFFDPY